MDSAIFNYFLPNELISQYPPSPRDSSRLMVLKSKYYEHRNFFDLKDYLKKGDVLVLNNTKVFPARLLGKKSTGGKVEITLLTDMGDGIWSCLPKGGPFELKTKIYFKDNISGSLIRENEGFIISFFGQKDVAHIIRNLGRTPLPPYVKRSIPLEKYQTVFAKHSASVAAPTAGLHFTELLLNDLENKGVKLAFVTLHIGLGTFSPVKSMNIENHKMEPEYFEVSEECCNIINKGKRIIVVGTTTIKALESASDENGVYPCHGWSNLFIYPPYKFKVESDALLTNFHLPMSTLLMLVSAYKSREEILKAYKKAVTLGYNFYSFGDAMLIFREDYV
jgi:S-adenosylmethionine:tRNA ribosyltransferase-isomerase|tara:strand:+ start:673 stop:1677 length:1005 start_codon:yes stop_codon:yes gene_type:complete